MCVAFCFKMSSVRRAPRLPAPPLVDGVPRGSTSRITQPVSGPGAPVHRVPSRRSSGSGCRAVARVLVRFSPVLLAWDVFCRRMGWVIPICGSFNPTVLYEWPPPWSSKYYPHGEAGREKRHWMDVMRQISEGATQYRNFEGQLVQYSGNPPFPPMNFSYQGPAPRPGVDVVVRRPWVPRGRRYSAADLVEPRDAVVELNENDPSYEFRMVHYMCYCCDRADRFVPRLGIESDFWRRRPGGLHFRSTLSRSVQDSRRRLREYDPCVPVPESGDELFGDVLRSIDEFNRDVKVPSIRAPGSRSSRRFARRRALKLFQPEEMWTSVDSSIPMVESVMRLGDSEGESLDSDGLP